MSLPLWHAVLHTTSCVPRKDGGLHAAIAKAACCSCQVLSSQTTWWCWLLPNHSARFPALNLHWLSCAASMIHSLGAALPSAGGGCGNRCPGHGRATWVYRSSRCASTHVPVQWLRPLSAANWFSQWLTCILLLQLACIQSHACADAECRFARPWSTYCRKLQLIHAPTV